MQALKNHLVGDYAETHEVLHALLNAHHSTQTGATTDYATEFANYSMLWHVGSDTPSRNSALGNKRISAQQAKDALTKTRFPK